MRLRSMKTSALLLAVLLVSGFVNEASAENTAAAKPVVKTPPCAACQRGPINYNVPLSELYRLHPHLIPREIPVRPQPPVQTGSACSTGPNGVTKCGACL